MITVLMTIFITVPTKAAVCPVPCLSCSLDTVESIVIDWVRNVTSKEKSRWVCDEIESGLCSK